MLQAGVACHQGWTLQQARDVPLTDLYTLVAYKALEAEELRRDDPPGPASSSSGTGGGRQQVVTTEFQLRSTK